MALLHLFLDREGEAFLVFVVEGLESNWEDAADGARASEPVVEAIDGFKHAWTVKSMRTDPRAGAPRKSLRGPRIRVREHLGGGWTFGRLWVCLRV